MEPKCLRILRRRASPLHWISWCLRFHLRVPWLNSVTWQGMSRWSCIDAAAMTSGCPSIFGRERLLFLEEGLQLEWRLGLKDRVMIFLQLGLSQGSLVFMHLGRI